MYLFQTIKVLLNDIKMVLVVLIDIDRTSNHFESFHILDELGILVAYIIGEIDWAIDICRNLSFGWDNTVNKEVCNNLFATVLFRCWKKNYKLQKLANFPKPGQMNIVRIDLIYKFVSCNCKF
jgi:hypothetical protein